MVLQTILKIIIDLGIHQTTENYEQAMGNHVVMREGTAWCRNLFVKNYFVKGCIKRKSGRI
jgi:hypothetical protein